MPLFGLSKKSKLRSTRAGASAKPLKDHRLVQQQISQRQAKKLVVPGQPPYKQIDSNIWEIRLLTVLRGRPQDPIKCMTRTTLILQDKTPYETVSYCWGSSSKAGVVEIDGLRVLVTQSAEQLLQRVRLPDRDRTIWIDAICIDQDDEHEKGRQVGFMAATYRCAWRNVIWLGSDKGNAGRVQATLHAVLADIWKHTNGFKALYDLTHTHVEHPRLRRNGSLLDQTIDPRPLKQLFSSPWFGRLWVVQEAALAIDNVCHFGPATFGLTNILKVALWLVWNTRMVHDKDLLCAPGLLSAANMWYLVDHECVPTVIRKKATHTLYQIWELLQDYQVSNAKDNIYALLGVYRRWETNVYQCLPPIVPKYEKSVPQSEVFMEATRVMIEDSKSLEILRSRSLTANNASETSIPSWTVDFGRKRHTAPSPVSFEGNFQADSGIKIQARTMPANGDNRILVLRGIQCDTIVQKTSTTQSWNTGAGSPSLREIWLLVHQLQKQYSSRHLLKETALTLMGGVNWAGEHPTEKDAREAEGLLDHFYRPQGNKIPAGYLHCLDGIERSSTGRCFIVTRNGRIGLGPPQSQVGDQVTILYGGAVPFLLRPASNGNHSQVCMMGECYIHGVMFGETVREHKAAGRRDEIFHIV